ncbi:Flp pilus assembly protein CpaB [Paenibacillus sp.]|uniref:Flp pilus assembly protein CpaB n=1 Tax=Paenibacillus sp. TaxID=58172 RepID=UPI002D30F3CD|nr:Flp pilus assembly protein CpaB [Paenibacillus sp.]HZG58200.1 Flp pilus assembly protein CpaB [Paenibacillus sp.]
MYYRKLYLVISLIFAMITTYAGYWIVSSVDKPNVPYVEYPVAARALEPLSTVSEQDLARIQVPEGALDGVAFLRDPQEIIGRTVMHGIAQGSLFAAEDFLNVDTVNPFHLPEGYRAITVENTPVIGLGGHLRPGMFVDIIWIRQDGDGSRALLAFQNIKVLAVGSPGTLELPEAAKTVTLMLRAEEALAFALQAQTGTFALTLRPAPTEPAVTVEPLHVNDMIRP